MGFFTRLTEHLRERLQAKVVCRHIRDIARRDLVEVLQNGPYFDDDAWTEYLEELADKLKSPLSNRELRSMAFASWHKSNELAAQSHVPPSRSSSHTDTGTQGEVEVHRRPDVKVGGVHDEESLRNNIKACLEQATKPLPKEVIEQVSRDLAKSSRLKN